VLFRSGNIEAIRPLRDGVIADFESWVKMGAADPRSGGDVKTREAVDFKEAREFWSFRQITKPELPQVKKTDWPRSAIDHFVLAKLEAQRLSPAEDASARTLLRRASYDLIGLPPTPAEIDATNAPGLYRLTLSAAEMNADSIATWFPLVMAGLPDKMNILLDLLQDDQEHTIDRLREGHVLAAVTADQRVVQGFKQVPLGSLEYIAVASPGFVKNHFEPSFSYDDFKTAPSLAFNRKDTLLNQWSNKAFDKDIIGNNHWVPSYEGYIRCCLEGVGWGLHPLMSAKPYIDEGKLIEFMPEYRVKIPLYWQCGRVSGQLMRDLTDLVVEIAGDWLTPDS